MQTSVFENVIYINLGIYAKLFNFVKSLGRLGDSGIDLRHGQ